MSYDPNLPILSATDLQIRNELAWWKCRYCGFVESGSMTTDAEARRCAAHEYRCPKRSTDNKPSQFERDAYQHVHAAGLRRDLLVLRCNINNQIRLRLHTWLFNSSARRLRRAAIEDLCSQICDVYAQATILGLDDGWTEPRE